MTYGICSCGVKGYLVEYPFPYYNGCFFVCCTDCYDHFEQIDSYDFVDIDSLNDIAWIGSETQLRLRTGKGDRWKLNRTDGSLFKARMKRIQAKKVRRMGKEMIREQVA